MSKYSALIKRASNATAALALTVASLTPAVMLGSKASAGQMTERKITMSNSLAARDNNTYTVSFKPSGSSTVKGIVVEFCSNNPIIGAACTAPAGLDVAGTSDPQTVDLVAFTVASATNRVTLTDGTGSSAASTDTYTFTMNVDNPDAVGTFWARVLTFASDTDAINYDDETPGAYTDAGGVALSTTNDVTINARVQETLTFCAGADADASATALCANLDGQVVDLGVLATGAIRVSPVLNDFDGNEKEGKILVDTNAFYGAKIYYISNNSLKTSGVADCEDDDTSVVNQCFNSASAGVLIGAGTEKFGMRLTEPTDHVDVPDENALSATAPYNGANHSWVTDASTEIASVGGVLGMDGMTLEFAATPSATTPSGYYTTSANFIAVASF